MTNASTNVRLETGLETLERWADEARQSQKNVLYKALFAITDGSVFRNYGVLQDTLNPREFFILVREDLVLKIAYPDYDTFAIVYIGSLEDAPGLDVAMEESA